MKTPTVHMNGTAKSDLLRQNIEAANAVDTAIDQLCRAIPNGRDYYPQGPEALEQAMTEHRARRARLDAVRNELMDIAEAIANQGKD